jgi:hypothetical protein
VLGETAATANVAGTPNLATTATAASAAGTYPITVVTAGSLSAANYDFPTASFGTGILTVGQGAVSTLSVGSTLPGSTYGQTVSFTVAVTPPSGGQTPTGSVQFLVDGSNFGSPVALSGGQTSSPVVSNLSAGAHTVLAIYSGDSNYAAATSVSLTQSVTQAHLAVVPDDQSRPLGQAIPTLTAHFTGFMLGETAITTNLTGSPELTTSASLTSPVGTYPITVGSAGTLAAANYDFPAASFGTGTLTVTQGMVVGVVVGTTQQNSTYGQSVSFTVSVNPPSGGPTPTGSVQFVVDGTNLGSPVDLAGGQATSAAVNNLPATGHSVLANYQGDANYAADSGSLTQIVTRAHLAVVPDNLSSTAGLANPTLTAHLTGFVLGETAASANVTGIADLTTAATGASPSGTYPITVTSAGTLGAANYDFPSDLFGQGILTVATATLASITLNPANPSISKGTMQPFTATGTFSDGSTQDLTSQVTWVSAAPAVATVSVTGVATGVATGTSTINATLGGITGSTVLTVNPATLLAINLVPAGPSISQGTTQPFTAIGTFSDHSTQNLTGQVTWVSDSAAVATISTAGVATGAAAGTSTISARLGGVNGSTVLTVTAPPPVATPGTNHEFYPAGERQGFVDLATAYTQRAARLTAIAATAPDPLKLPLTELAAYYWIQAQTYSTLANDPPDDDFTTVAPPQAATLPPLGAGGGITQAQADAFNALFAEQAQAVGLGRALSTALDRAQAAANDPTNVASEQLQLAAVTMFSQELGQVATDEPALLASVQATGVADVSVSPSDVAALQAMVAGAGLPITLIQALKQLQASAAQLQQIQGQFATVDPSVTAGSLAAILTDPGFKALVQQSSQSLTATVLLSGNLSSGSDSGASHDDGIINSPTPTFVGTAPPGTIVELFAQRAVDSTPLMIGRGVSDDTGKWSVAANLPADGSYAISVRYSGGSSGSGQQSPLTTIAVDTVAPRITNATYKPKSGLVTVTFADPIGLDPASLASSYFMARMKGARSPALTMSGFQRVGTQEVMFTVTRGRSHPTSISLQVISGGVRDVAGNSLDGGFNGTFPTGTGHGHGDFFAQLPIIPRKVPKPRKGSPKSKR